MQSLRCCSSDAVQLNLASLPPPPPSSSVSNTTANAMSSTISADLSIDEEESTETRIDKVCSLVGE
ncbi:glutaredoxin-C6-like protein [Corchorus capsularis]|uniref:Glutaredoxin-C6-like protein n=1 Tax=Corchorus capsularis TaxID=210143 RepID=A0A1R3JCK4_COCAP|nr:glutaredoxin-C6-like protein [Corchorus capsularis]